MAANANGNTIYDVLIIGGGPAGMTAALYAGRAMLKVAVIEAAVPGGQAAITEMVENYPGFPEGILGPDLSAKMEEQAKRFGAEFISNTVESAELQGPVKTVRCSGDEVYRGRTVIIATGASHKHLGVKGEEEYSGKGISWCATCDGAFFKGEDLVVVGGGDSAIEEGIFLTKYAKSVTVIHRRDTLRAQKILQDRAFREPKMRFVWDTVVEEIGGDGMKVTHVRAKNLKTGETGEIPCGGVFIYVGMLPATGFLPPELERDAEQYLITDENLQTKIPGVFAAGDCRRKLVRQVANAVGEGCVAAIMAEKYLAQTRETRA